ncbi:MAG: UvrD-helicase domain-containing protein [Pseudolactococcus raffinolactis]
MNEIFKRNIDPIVFSKDALPKSTLNGLMDKESQYLEAIAAAIKLSDKVRIDLAKYQEQNRHLTTQLNVYKSEQASKNEQFKLLQSQQNTLREEIQKVKVENTHTAKSLQSEQEKNLADQKAIENERAVFKQLIFRLEEEKKDLLKTRDTLLVQVKEEQQLQDEQLVLSKSPDLSAEQMSMLDIIEGSHFLIAPPGAGKTTILTERLKGAIDRYEDQQILCLTFTTRAAVEMQERAYKVLNDRSPFIGNFHGFCFDQIQHGTYLEPKFKRYGILDDEYRDVIWLEALLCFNNLKQDISSEWLGLTGSFTWNDNLVNAGASNNFKSLFMEAYSYILLLDIAPNDYYRQVALTVLRSKVPELIIAAFSFFEQSDFNASILADNIWFVFCAFKELKNQGQVLDFDDILCLGLVEIVSQKKKWRFVQVDEVQDLSPLQWELLSALCDEQTHIFVVGDPNQSIYGFLGADVDTLDQRTAGFKRHSLISNYRSDPEIVNLLNRYRATHWRLPAMAARKVKAGKKSTLLLEYPDEVAEQHNNISAVQEILKDSVRNVGILLTTNKLCETYCNLLQMQDITFFRVSQFDLMQKAVIQDWLSLLRLYLGKGCRKDWWRLVYRFAKSEHNDVQVTKPNVIRFVNQLYNLGVSPSDITSNWEGKTIYSSKSHQNLFDYKAKKLISAYRQKGIVIFDTETTGLDFKHSKVVQLAAVRLIDGKIDAVFDQYVKLDFDGDPTLMKAFEDTQQIHKISFEQLNTGKQFSKVMFDFLEFIGECPIVAHNLNFDNTMLRMNVFNDESNYNLIMRFHEVSNNLQFDSLSLARQLFPKEDSYKLGDLLSAFNLEGINSHNALDDVKATASLMTHLITTLEQRLEQIDTVIDSFDYLVGPLAKHWTILRRRLQSYVEGDSESDLTQILSEWLDYARQPGWYSEDSLNTTMDDVNTKLIPWLEKNQYRGVFCDLIDESSPKVEKLFTLKEADLIDPEVHRVVVSTVHRAKGIEFETVMVPQVVEGNYPLWCPNDAPIQQKKQRQLEGCRLLYVAISRPKSKLIVSYHTRKGKWGKYLSEFLEPCRDSFSYVNYRRRREDSLSTERLS